MLNPDTSGFVKDLTCRSEPGSPCRRVRRKRGALGSGSIISLSLGRASGLRKQTAGRDCKKRAALVKVGWGF